MNCFYPSGSMANNTTPTQIYIEISDKLYKDRSNLNDTESDTLQVCRDVFNIINRSPRWARIGRLDSASFTKFWERTADEVAGHTLILNMTLFDSNSICNIPLNGYDFDGTFIGGGSVIVRNSDDSYSVTVDSGDTLTLPDTTINIYANSVLQESVTFATLSNQTINITN